MNNSMIVFFLCPNCLQFNLQMRVFQNCLQKKCTKFNINKHKNRTELHEHLKSTDCILFLKRKIFLPPK